MGIDTRYQNLACYQNLSPAHRDCLDELAKVYGEQLNGLIKSGGSLFTLHDFDHHCYDLYRIINNSLCNMDVDMSGEDSRKLSEHELFLLDMAVLLHDIGMSAEVNLVVNRRSHASRSAELILSEWNNTASTLYVYGNRVGLSENDIIALAEIIKAHSDDKEVGDTFKTGIFAQNLLDRMPASSPNGTVRARFLAGILRMADELDITLDRRGNARLTEQLDLTNDDNRYSCDCWEKLTYFSQVALDSKVRVQLDLEINRNGIQERIDFADGDAVLSGIWDVYQKVLKEWGAIQKEIFQGTDGAHEIIRVETVKVVSELQPVNDFLAGKAKAREDLSSPVHGIDPLRLVKPSRKAVESEGAADPSPGAGEKAGDIPPSPERAPEILLPTAKAEIDTQIKEKRLIRPGHFMMHTGLCARDWVNTAALLQQSGLFERCIQTIARHIKNNDQIDLSNTVILGIDLHGTLLGVRVAATLHRPFTFLVPPQKLPTSGGRDGEADLSAYAHAVCITDVLSSGHTISEATRQRGLHDKLQGVYALLYRPARCATRAVPLELSCPMYCISDTFSIEVVESKDCPWKASGNCLDCNKIIQ